ncbi:MAG: D-glycerate dehydrogenase [Desulfomonile sp.]|nr:D-glycerate dehydrogenase [Desulfomonile sp.]
MKVLVTGRLPEEVFELIRKEHELEFNSEDHPMERGELLRRVRNKVGLLSMITDRIDNELFDHAPYLKVVANYAVGFNNIDLNEARARGIWVTNTPGVLDDATADLTFALILATARQVVSMDRLTRAGEFKHYGPMLFLGTEVSGKTLGIVGLGNIGRAVARRAAGFNMAVLYHNRRRVDPSVERALNATYVGLDDLLSRSDFVTLHVPLTDETRHLIGPEQLRKMKRTAFLINASRGPVVDEQALVEALQARIIAGAGLDVYENEPALTPGLVDLDNVVLLPHIGSATVETRTRMAFLAAENLLTGLRGQVPTNCLTCG